MPMLSPPIPMVLVALLLRSMGIGGDSIGNTHLDTTLFITFCGYMGDSGDQDSAEDCELGHAVEEDER